MKRNLAKFFTCAILVGCNATYEKPQTTESTSNINHDKTVSEVMTKSKQVLLLDGYQIQSFDDGAGIISTSPKYIKLTPAQADCGSTLGLDYLKDKRTYTTVAINIVVTNDSLTVKPNIEGEYKPGSSSQDITLSCVSRGVIEKDLLTKILQ